MTKKILGLDLGTNSIGWSLIDKENKKILGMGSRIIPMGTDKQDYEKGVGITKNAERRTKRTIRKMNKRYKLRRNKLLFILHKLGMLPEQFQFRYRVRDEKGRLTTEYKNGLPPQKHLQDLELHPIKKGTLQLDSLQHYQLRASAIENLVTSEELGKVLYSFNQLRGYSGGNNDDDTKKEKEEENDDESVKKYEVFNKKVLIQKVEQSESKFQGRGKNKGQEFNKFDVTILLDDELLEGETELQNLKEKEGQEEELEIRIRKNKKGETTSVVFALPQKTNWRKQMEKTEEDLKKENLHVSQLILRDLRKNKWTKIRNRVFLRNRYQAEFDAVWETQSRSHSILNDTPKEKIEQIANYLFPGKSETQNKLRQAAINGGLKYIIKEQIIYYQRPLKPQDDKISECQFEKGEKVLANTHPLFQEFRCWDQINRLYITSKQEVYDEKKKKSIFRYTDRFLTIEEKQEIYNRLQTQKQLGFGEVAKIVNLKNDKVEYLNGLNPKAKLKGCDTLIEIKKKLGEHFELLYKSDKNIIENIWKAIFDNANNGSEYDSNSIKVCSIKDALHSLNNEVLITDLALKFAQNVRFPRKYSSISAKAINNILPLMQLNSTSVSSKLKENFSNIQHLIETGEVLNDNLLEDYVINFVKNNPNAIETGGFVYAFASSLVYGKHTAEKIKGQLNDYHQIQYEKRNLRNPIVEQISNETMQVVKSIWKQYKFKPEELEIRVELARDLKNSAAERDKIYKAQVRNKRTNDNIKEKLEGARIAITDENILKYKLYDQQKFISPYSGEIMEISLFDSYQIDHIIPKSRYFDDSFSNKVLVEGNLNNEKSNRTAWEYISQQNSQYKILQIERYLNHINENYFGRKKKNLLMEKIPTNPVVRQLKNTQYVTVAVKNELAKIVGSDNIKTSTGEVTDFLRSRWGLKDLFMKLTKERFKQMELWDINPETGKPNEEWVKKEFDKKKNKDVLRIKNWSKRYDHRHHAIDALVVALTEQGHIQRLNNLNKYLQDELTKRKEEFNIELKEDESILEAFFNLEKQRREKIQKQIESSRFFEKPFEDLIKQAEKFLETMVVSIKPKDKLGIKSDEKGNKQLKIRGALHQETYYGKLKGKDTKTIEISKLSAKDISKIIDQDVLAKEIDAHRKKYDSIKEAFTGEGLKAFNESRFQRKKPNKLKPPVYKIKIWYSAKEDEESTLQRLYDGNEKLSVVTGDNYLFLVMEKETSKGKERIFDIASLYDAAIIAKNELKDSVSDFKNKIAEDYRLTYGERNKQKGKPQDNPDRVLFTLQQNDLVYLPERADDPIEKMNNEELKQWLNDLENKKRFSKRVYKVVMFTGTDCKFIPHNYANSISIAKDLTKEQKDLLKRKHEGKKSIPKSELNFVEFGSYRDCSPYESGEIFIRSLTTDKKSKSKEIKPLKIQDSCIKLKVDWLGNISKA